jgi:hypothetical protein
VSDNVTPISVVPIDAEQTAMWNAGADFLRELADQMEAGEISEMVVVYNSLTERSFASFGHFEDRWRLLGALEDAKQSVADT